MKGLSKYAVLCLIISLMLPLSLSAGGGDIKYTNDQSSTGTTKTINYINWAPTLQEALDLANRKNRIVYYLQVVGELDGGI